MIFSCAWRGVMASVVLIASTSSLARNWAMASYTKHHKTSCRVSMLWLSRISVISVECHISHIWWILSFQFISISFHIISCLHHSPSIFYIYSSPAQVGARRGGHTVSPSHLVLRRGLGQSLPSKVQCGSGLVAGRRLHT